MKQFSIGGSSREPDGPLLARAAQDPAPAYPMTTKKSATGSGAAARERFFAPILALTLAVAAAPRLTAQAPATPPDALQCEAQRMKGDPNFRACYQRLTRASDPAVQAEGFWGLGDYRAANDAFRAAVKQRDKDPAPRTRWGRMYLEHWQPADAKDLFQEALKLKSDYAPALLGMGLVAGEQFEGEAIKYAEQALKADPKLYQAHELIARVQLEDGSPQKAAEAAKKALEISPGALDAMAILGTIDLLDDKESPWMARVLQINPKYGNAYAIAAHFFMINRRYEEGIAWYRKALELDPSLHSARSDMGVNLMRLGQTEEARKELEQAYNAGYQDPETVNSLRLLDSYKDYVTFKTARTILVLHKKEAQLLRPYFEAEFERALANYDQFKLTKPVQIEVYPNHEDFAVRTLGMPGLGALGVTFGYVVAMDSPSARKPGQWHWASTMWHELSHVYALEMTNHRVPRWFTEGLAVYEETAASPDWGDRLDPGTINALKGKKLLPVAELDRGFMHPTYGEQVTVSYYQGGKICNFIDQKWGYDKLIAMLHDFGNKMTTPEVIEKEFQMKPEEFDRQFMAWLEPQVKNTVEHYDEWRKRIRGVSEAVKAKNWDTVISEGEAIRDFYPEYVEMGNVYEFLAKAYAAKGDKAKAQAELERYSKIGGRDPETLKELSEMQLAQGRKKDAAATLERLNLIYLEDEEAHSRLGALDLDLGNTAGAVREYQAVLNLKPVDPAAAHLGLAVAYKKENRLNEARDEVISALEAAPGYKPAQKLLLELSGNESN
jgi:tetratricopeptide (TPR) repeat protein